MGHKTRTKVIRAGMTLFQLDELESSGALPSFRSGTNAPATEIQNSNALDQ